MPSWQAVRLSLPMIRPCYLPMRAWSNSRMFSLGARIGLMSGLPRPSVAFVQAASITIWRMSATRPVTTLFSRCWAILVLAIISSTMPSTMHGGF